MATKEETKVVKANTSKKVWTKLDIAEKLSNKDGIAKSEAINRVESIFEIIGEMLLKLPLNDSIKLGNLGILTTKTTKAGERRNPKTQEKVKVESKRVAKFRVLPKFKTLLNENK